MVTAQISTRRLRNQRVHARKGGSLGLRVSGSKMLRVSAFWFLVTGYGYQTAFRNKKRGNGDEKKEQGTRNEIPEPAMI